MAVVPITELLTDEVLDQMVADTLARMAEENKAAKAMYDSGEFDAKVAELIFLLQDVQVQWDTDLLHEVLWAIDIIQLAKWVEVEEATFPTYQLVYERLKFTQIHGQGTITKVELCH